MDWQLRGWRSSHRSASTKARVDAGATVKYVFNVSEEHFTTFGSEWHTYDPVEQDTGTFTLPAAYPQDYRIFVSGHFKLIENGQTTPGATYYQVVASTPKSQNWFEEVDALVTAIRDMAQDFAEKAPQVIDAILNHTGQFFDTLLSGFTGAANQIINELTTTPLLLNALYKWIAPNVTIPQGFDPFNAEQLQDFLLRYAGLTWDHVSNLMMQELGDGNVAAIKTVAGWLQNLSDESADQPGAMRQFIQNLIDGQVPGISVQGILEKAATNAGNEIALGLAKALPQLLAKLLPGGGQLMTILRGVEWLIQNRDKLTELYNQLMGPGIDALLAFNSDQFKTALVNGFHTALPIGMGFLAGQIGLSSLPKDIQKALAFIPKEVDKGLRDAIRNTAGVVLKGGTKGGRNDGLLGGREPKTFAYNGKQYKLWETKESQHTFVKLGEVNGKTYVLTSTSFVDSAVNDFTAVKSRAQTLADGAKKPPTPPAKKPSDFKNLGNGVDPQLDSAENTLILDIQHGQCKILDGGCFATGTKLWTPDGYRNVADIREGELVFSRDQDRPNGLIEAKPVEKVFQRFTEVLHLHVGGQVIRTTGEHPFYAYNKGWTAAQELVPGDWVLTAAGDWRQVEEALATGYLEVVYNLRVAEHHTYFVGGEEWGWAAWVHNACIEYDQVQTTIADGMGLAQETWEYRQHQATSNPATALRAAWGRGEKNAAIAHVSGENTAYRYGSGITGHAEKSMAKGLARIGIPSATRHVTKLISERKPCDECQTILNNWLQNQRGKLIVYYLIPYVENEDGSVLLNRYRELGIGT